jgi:hypothetical protein
MPNQRSAKRELSNSGSDKRQRPLKPHVEWDELIASADIARPEVHRDLITAINCRHPVTITGYAPSDQGDERPQYVAEPHMYGERGGEPTVLAYVTGGPHGGTSGWTPFHVPAIDHIVIHAEEHFEPRPIPEQFGQVRGGPSPIDTGERNA